MKEFVKKHKIKIIMLSSVVFAFSIGYRRGIHHTNFKLAKGISNFFAKFADISEF